MPTPNVPENTAPSSRGKVASIGVIGNLGGGTAAGSSTNNLNIGGFSNAPYWSSSEAPPILGNDVLINIFGGVNSDVTRLTSNYVRAIRSF